MKKYLFLLIICAISVVLNAQTLNISSNDMILCPGESATLTATADLPNRVLNFPRAANQTIVLNNTQQETVSTFSYEFWFNTPDSIVLLPEHVDGIGIYDGQSGQNYAFYPQQIYSGIQRRASGISVGINGISVMEHCHQFIASRLTYAANLIGWHHCAVVYTSNNFELFIDGVSVGTRANGSNYANTPINSGVPLTVAFRPNIGNFYPPLSGIDADPNDGYLGQLDEFRVWKIALSAADVSAIYNRKLISANMQNVIVHMPFDMGTQANFSTITSSPTITIAAPSPAAGVTFPSVAIPQIGTFAGAALPSAIYSPFVIGYVWNDGTIGNTHIVSPIGPSTTFTCTATAGTSNSSSSITIATSAPEATVSTLNPLVFCADTSATLTANTGTAYLWSNGATTPSIVVDSTGTYTVAVTNADNCIATSAGTSITVNPMPTPAITTLSATTFCEGDSVQLLSSLDANFLWNTNETDSLITVHTAGDYTVTLTNIYNCTATSEPISVVVNPNPVANIVANGPLSFCLGNEVQLTSSSGIPTWSTGSSDTTITVIQTEVIELLVTNEFGCTDTDSLSITVNPLPIPIITPLSSTTFCEGDSLQLLSSLDTNFLWNTNETDSLITVHTAGDYTVTLTNIYNCTATSEPVTVVVNPNPIATIVANGPLSFCLGNEVQLTSTNGIPTWSTGSNDTTISVIQTELIGLLVTNEFGCTDTDSLTITVNPLPTPAITPLSATTFCEGDSVQLLSSLDANFLWSTNETDSLITVHTSGVYTVTLTNIYNCTATSEPVTVVVNPNPIAAIVANGPLSFCLGNEVQLTSTNGIPTWSTGSNDTTISVIQTELIGLLVTNEFGCTDTDTLGITVFELPVVTAAADTAACISNGPFTLHATPDSGTWTGDNVSSNIFNPTTEGIFGFEYSFTDGNGCTNLDSIYFTIVNPLQITAGTDVSVCLPSDTVHLGSNASPLGGIWTGDNVTAEGNVLPTLSGSFAYLYSFQDLCSTNDTVYINAYNSPSAPVIGGELFICKNTPSQLWSNYVGGNVWSTSDVADSIYIIESGVYGLTYTDPQGCSSFSQVTIQQYPDAQIPIISGASNAVYSNIYTYSVALLPNYTYNWTVTGGTIVSGQGTNIIEVSWDQFVTGSGEIQLTWSNIYGCESTRFYAVSVDVSVQEMMASSLIIYPNPTRDVVNIQWDFMSENTYLTVFDNTGKLLSTKKLNNQSLQNVDFSGYENGVYQLRLSNENAVIMKAIVVTR